MRKWCQTTILTGAACVALTTALSAQSASSAKRGGPFDACTLATNAEFQQASEVKPELARFWSAPEPVYGGMACQYGKGLIQVYEPSAGSSAAAGLERTLKIFKLEKEARLPVQGLGDRAFFAEIYPDDQYRRAGLLAVYVGQRVVTLFMEPNHNERLALTRPRLERLAKVVLPRLR
jgi:hypothetical protein